MPFNGSGTFNRTDGTRSGTQTWQDARDAGVKIRADDHDTHDQDIADGLENTVTLDGQNTTTTDNAILRYDSGNSQFEGVTISASELVGRSATGDVRSLSAATARQTIGLGTAASTNNAVLQYSSADGQYVEKTTITSVDIGSGVNTDPEHATDSGTDAYVSATNTTPPADGVTITRDFQSANTTTTPTLDGKTITDPGGNAIWSNAIDGVHELKYVSGTDTYLLLNPYPSSDNKDQSYVRRDPNGRARFSDPSAAQDAATKAYADTKARIATGTYTGDGSTSQSITGVGFQPTWLQIIPVADNSSNVEVHTANAPLMAGAAEGKSLTEFGAGGHEIQNGPIASLDSDGFTVDDGGNDGDPNTNGQKYSYTAIG